MEINTENYITIEEAAERLGYSRQHVYRLKKQGLIVVRKIFGRMLVDIEKTIELLKNPPTSHPNQLKLFEDGNNQQSGQAS
jgi:excisionase family DNA binding protein